MEIVYSAPIDALAFTLATDVFEITPAADRPIMVYGFASGRRPTSATRTRRCCRIGLYRDVTAGSTGTR